MAVNIATMTSSNRAFIMQLATLFNSMNATISIITPATE